MGLDMYLFRIPKMDDLSFKELIELDENIMEEDDKEGYFHTKYKPYLHKRWEYFDTLSMVHQVGYWRKSNQIHSWFVNNVQNGVDNCQDHIVTKEQIKSLLNTCYEVDKVFKSSIATDGRTKNGETLKDGVWIPVYEDGTVFVDLDIDSINQLLPPQSGFFFGSTEVDQWYYYDITNTIKILEKVLVEVDFENNFVFYCSSW